MNRTYDLKETMPFLIEAANYSYPTEIMILDYNSQDDLAEYIQEVRRNTVFMDSSRLSYVKYDKRDYYHMAHARNLSVLASKGDYVIISCADIKPVKQYVEIVREGIEEGCVWLRHRQRFIGVVTVQRKEFMDAGGFDERFEFYGKEDKDIVLRLERRGAKYKVLPTYLLDLIPTPKADKFKNYRLVLSRGEVNRRSKAIYEENIANEVLVANEGKEWGQWE